MMFSKRSVDSEIDAEIISTLLTVGSIEKCVLRDVISEMSDTVYCDLFGRNMLVPKF